MQQQLLGHYLILELDSPRNIIRRDIVCNYKTKFFGSRWKGFAEIPLSVFPDRIEKINLFAIFNYSQQTEYILKAIQIKKEEIHQIKKQNSADTITFRGKYLYPAQKDTINVEKIPEQSKAIEPKEKKISEENNQILTERIHLIWSSLEGGSPDYHQPDLFPPCPDLHNSID